MFITDASAYPASSNKPTTVFIAGATGYLGSRLCKQLLQRGHQVLALARPGSEYKAPQGCQIVVADALRAESYAAQVPANCVFVHLVGVAHPSPAKARDFIDIDLASVREALIAAKSAAHFVYVSVAQPAPVMQAYIAARQEAERLILQSGLDATVLRPWYVLGPGHRWPNLLKPGYWLLEHMSWTAEAAQRLGLVTLKQMLNALTFAVENAEPGRQMFDVQRIRSFDA